MIQYALLALDRTEIRTRYAPADVATRRRVLRRLTDHLLDIPHHLAMRYGLGKVIGEDSAVRKGLQRVAHQVTGLPSLGTQEPARDAGIDACALKRLEPLQKDIRLGKISDDRATSERRLSRSA